MINNNKYIIRKNELNWRYIQDTQTGETYMTDGSQISDNYVEEIIKLLNQQDNEIRNWKSWATQLETTLEIFSTIAIIAEENNLNLNEIKDIIEKNLTEKQWKMSLNNIKI